LGLHRFRTLVARGSGGERWGSGGEAWGRMGKDGDAWGRVGKGGEGWGRVGKSREKTLRIIQKYGPAGEPFGVVVEWIERRAGQGVVGCEFESRSCQ